MCFTAVFIEGIVVFGAFPYVAVLLEQRGAGGLKEAGFVLAGFALGGFCYIALVRVMLNTLGAVQFDPRRGGAIAGAGFAALALEVSWPVEMAMLFRDRARLLHDPQFATDPSDRTRAGKPRVSRRRARVFLFSRASRRPADLPAWV